MNMSGIPYKVALFFVLTLIGLWPTLWAGGPLIFHDSEGYYHTGGLALEALEARVFDPGLEQAEGERASGGDGSTSSAFGLRSLPFSVFANVTMRMFGAFGTVIVMSALVALLILKFIERLPLRLQGLVGVGTTGLTLMPFYAGQLMPDILAGTLILSAMVLALQPDLQRGWVLFLLGVICFCILSHYAHIPLGLAVCSALFVIVWQRGTRIYALVMLVPIVLALVVNLGISMLVQIDQNAQDSASATQQSLSQTSGLSIAPARFPILLARSLADGPALKYLQEACPDPRFAMCELYDAFPTNVGAALWGENSIYGRATPEQERRIANEEIPLLWAAFKAYPLEQTQALLNNAVKQFFLIGFPIIITAETTVTSPNSLSIQEFESFDERDQRALEYMQLVSLAVAVLAIIANFKVMPGPMRSVVWLLLISLVVNAAVCGGLSVPVDRYQGRIIWCVVLLGFTSFAYRPTLGFLRKGGMHHHQ